MALVNRQHIFKIFISFSLYTYRFFDTIIRLTLWFFHQEQFWISKKICLSLDIFWKISLTPTKLRLIPYNRIYFLLANDVFCWINLLSPIKRLVTFMTLWFRLPCFCFKSLFAWANFIYRECSIQFPTGLRNMTLGKNLQFSCKLIFMQYFLLIC